MSRRKPSSRYRARKARRKSKKLLIGLALMAAVIAAALLFLHLLNSPPRTAYTGLQISYNCTRMDRGKRSIKYIVIHDTANTKKGADADRHYQFFNSGNQSSSADFFVDSGKALQVNDYYHYYTWHCGDGGKSAKIKNRNSIGVEICINSDGNYEKAVQNAAALTSRLMKELQIDLDHVVRHLDASGKQCPGTMTEADWQNFKASLTVKKD